MQNLNFSLDIRFLLCDPEDTMDFRSGFLAGFSKNPIKNNQKMILKKFEKQRSILSVGSLLNNRLFENITEKSFTKEKLL